MTPPAPANTHAVRHHDAFDVTGINSWLTQQENRQVVLRRPPVGNRARTAHDMAREVRVQRLLKHNYPQVPTVLGLGGGPDHGWLPRARMLSGLHPPTPTRPSCSASAPSVRSRDCT
jgi:hypothetical protein